MFKQITTVFALVISAFTFSQVGIETDTPQATLDVVGKPADNSVLDGIIAPRLEGAQLRAKTYTAAQTGALVYVTLADTAPAGQTIDVKAAGYYYFNGTKWIPADGYNIYNANGALTSNRTLTLNGFPLDFVGTERKTYWDIGGRIHQESTDASSDAAMGFHGGSANLWIQQWYDSNSAITASGSATGLELATHFTDGPAPITLSTSSGGTGSLERMRITGEGNVGVNTADPTERFDNNGITRLRNLPLNGATNAINTDSDGNASSAQDQTFTATRTVVADDNGVLGYVTTLPSDAGTTKVIVNVNVPGTQNLMAAFSPPVTGQFTNESIDTYNSWTNNVFTVPSGLNGLYSIVMQNSNIHTSTGSATPTWSTIAFFEKSVDGGANWSDLMRHTYSNLAGTIVDNGNTLYWTGFLNAGDQVRVRFNCNSTTDNIVRNGGLSITKIAQ